MKKLHPAFSLSRKLCVLLLTLWGLTFARSSQAQFLDCSCLATQAVLFTNACSGVIPNLCTVVSNCWFPNASSTGFLCTQSPAAGTVVTANTPISFTLFDQPSNTPYTCNPTFSVGVNSNQFKLICASNLVVACNSTNLSFPAPTWTNTFCCTNPVMLFGPTLVTNWPVITASWIGQACGVVAFCSQTITFANSSGLPCNCLGISCSTNIIVKTCFATTAGGLTNVSWLPPTVTNSCLGTITNVFCTPPSGSPFPIGTNTVICTVYDSLGNAANCSFNVIVLGDTDPPNVLCQNLTVPCGSPWSPTPPPAFDFCCGAAVSVMLQNISTNIISQCQQKIFLDWHITDCNGNVTNCSEVVTIVDVTPPVILCNSNQTYQCSKAGTPGGWVPTPPTAFDACCPTPPIVSLVFAITNGNQCNQTITFVWQAEDCCTNKAYCTENITLVDTTPPALNCQPFRQIECGTNIVGDPPTAFDQCCGTNVTVSLLNIVTNFQSTCFSQYFVTWQGVDCCTNIAICSQLVQVVDTTPPNVICAPSTNVNCGQPLVFTPPVAFDDCCGALVTISVLNTVTNVPAQCPVTVTRTWTISDCCGNVTNCSQTIHIVDTIPPVITCPPNQTVACGSSWTLGSATATDNCCTNVSVLLFSLTTNSAPPCIQTVTAIWMARDCCFNIAFCTNTISIVDITPPVILCNSNQVFQCPLSGSAGGGWSPTPPQAFDLCCGPIAPTVSLVGAVTNGNQCNLTITLIWSATDCCSNTAYCTETVQFVDTTPPTLNCQPFRQVECGTNILGDPPTAFDQCCGTNVTISVLNIITNFQSTCFSQYFVVWQAVDCCTNIATCTQIVQVVDTTPPNVTCAPTATIQCGLPLVFTPPTAFDNCCGTLVTISVLNTITNAAGACPFTVTRTWTITDCCGNKTNCSQTIAVLDTVPPVITCGPNQTVQCGTSWSLSTPTATDACCSAVTVSLLSLTTNNSPPCLQTVTAVWQATDCCQNHSVCTQVVSVVDTTPPIINCKSNQVYACSTSGAAGNGWTPTPPTAFDLCCGPIAPLVSLVGSVTNGSQCNQKITLIWSATDCCSNTAYCTEIVTLIDTNPPIINCAQFKVVECGSGWTFDPPTAFDFCCGTNVTINVASNLVLVSSTCFSVYERYWTATDCCTNVAVCSQRVFENDTTPPAVACASNVTIQCGQPLVFTPPTATDACCPAASIIINVVNTVTNAAGNCPVAITRNWLISDCCGNSTNCSQTITVVDTVPPVITCGPNQTVQCGSLWSFIKATATDNCCNASSIIVSLANTFTNNAGCTATIGAVWKATDCCGNSSFCTNFVTTVDTLPPVINCPTTGVQLVPCGSPILPPVATDQCCGTNVTVSLLSAVTNVINSCRYYVTNTWKATDCCTNISTCVATVLVADVSPPVLICASNKTVQCGSTWTFDPPSAFDACCGTNVTVTVISSINLGPLCNRIHIRTWQAVDCCGNKTTCSQQVNEVDTLPPVVNCGSNFTVTVGTPWTFTPATAVDNCCPPNQVKVKVMFVTTNVVSACQVNYTITWKATDCCGNSSTCSQTISVTYLPPFNDPCGNAIPIALNAPYLCGTTICATPSSAGSLIPVPCGSSATTPDVWYSVTAICTGPITVDTCAPCPGFPMFDTVLSAYTGPCAAQTQVSATACNNNFCGLQSKITFNAVAGQTYRIRVSGASGAIGWFSIRAIQTVTLPPPNDLCSNAIAVNVGSYCGTTICATPSTLGSIPTPCGGSVNTPDVWYKFTPNCNGPITINTCGTCIPCPICVANPTFDTVLSVYSGQCSSFSQIACNNDATTGPCAGSPQSQVSFPGVAGVTYYIRVSGAGAATVGLFQLNISQAVATPPPNNPCANATPITAGTYAWNNCGATTDGPAAACQPLQDVWFKFTAPCAGQVWLNTCGSAIDTVMSVYSGNCGALTFIQCNDNAPIGSGPCGGSQQSFITFNATAGTTYFIRLGSPGPITGAGQLTLVGPVPPFPTCPPSGACTWTYFRIVGNPNCLKWSWSISSPCCAFIGNTNAGPVCSGDANTLAAAFVASINAACGGVGISAQAFPSFPPKQGRFGICSTCGTNLLLSVGGPGVLPPNQCVVGNTGGYSPIPVGWCSFNPDIELIPLSGFDLNHNGVDDAVDIDLGTSLDENGNGVPDEVEGCQSPELSSTPVSAVVQLGDTITLNASANGSAPLSYRWNRGGFPLSNGGAISGATTASLTIGPITQAEIGSYTITVTNGCGSVTTEAVTVSLAPPTLPVLYEENFDEGWFHFMVDTEISYHYLVEYKNDLNDPSWTTLTSAPGTGGPTLIYDSEASTQIRFYRVRRETGP